MPIISSENTNESPSPTPAHTPRSITDQMFLYVFKNEVRKVPQYIFFQSKVEHLIFQVTCISRFAEVRNFKYKSVLFHDYHALGINS